MTKGRKILLAFLAALLGLAVGAVSGSLIGTVKLSLMPGLEYASFKDFLVGLPLIFLEGLFWAVVGGVLFVFPPAFLLLAWYALTFGPQRLEAGRARWFILGFVALLYPPMWYYGPRDAVLLVVPMLLGAWTSVRFLNSRLSPRSGELALSGEKGPPKMK